MYLNLESEVFLKLNDSQFDTGIKVLSYYNRWIPEVVKTWTE